MEITKQRSSGKYLILFRSIFSLKFNKISHVQNWYTVGVLDGNPILVLGSKMSSERIVRALLLTNNKINPCLRLHRSFEQNFCRAPLLYKELVFWVTREIFSWSN